MTGLDMSPASIRVAVDIGGTFTDGVAEIGEGGHILTAKRLTTPGDPSLAVADVVADLVALARRGRNGGAAEISCRDIVHGTTLVTNTIIERKGVRTALVVTAGTRDTLEIAREIRYDSYDLDIELPRPLVPTRLIFEIDERLDASGRVLRRLDQAALKTLADRIARARVEAVGVCLLHSYLNPGHEAEIGAFLASRLPNLSISLSSRIAREMREYERMSTVAANAYVQPLASRYIRKLRRGLDEVGAKGPLRIMVSSGGFASDEAAAEAPITLLESGPAGGVISALNTAALAGVHDVLTFDMGGTTAKACVAVGGQPSVTYLFETARARRFKRGSGLPVLIPSIDLIEIGAGGGSIAAKSELGLLNVGPRSAAAVPGPACYGLGGTDPTVTDADLVLGYLDPGNFLGGRMSLDRSLADAAMARLARDLGIAPLELARGICDLVNENMATAARIHIAEHGLDPRALTMAATGGAGPVHAVEVAHKLGMRRVLCGVAAGVGSCLGFLAAPARADRVLPKAQPIGEVRPAELAPILAMLKGQIVEDLRKAGIADPAMEFLLSADIRYSGQGHSLVIEAPFAGFDEGAPSRYHEMFTSRYRQLYGHLVPGAVAQVVTWRLTGRSATRSREFIVDGVGAPAGTASHRQARERRIFLHDRRDYAVVPVHDRYALAPGTRLDGPLLLQEPESTIVVARAAQVEVLGNGTISIALPA
jgi:N-methylhydantoinase A